MIITVTPVVKVGSVFRNKDSFTMMVYVRFLGKSEEMLALIISVLIMGYEQANL